MMTVGPMLLLFALWGASQNNAVAKDRNQAKLCGSRVSKFVAGAARFGTKVVE